MYINKRLYSSVHYNTIFTIRFSSRLEVRTMCKMWVETWTNAIMQEFTDRVDDGTATFICVRASRSCGVQGPGQAITTLDMKFLSETPESQYSPHVPAKTAQHTSSTEKTLSCMYQKATSSNFSFHFFLYMYGLWGKN